MKKRNLVAAAGLSIALVGGSATAAMAEGAFTSSISGWLTGSSSRTWTDNNSDAAATSVNLQGCKFRTYGGVDTVTVKLVKKSGLLRFNKGERTISCKKSGTGNWGRQDKGNYYFTVTKINGHNSSDDKLDVKKVVVRF